MNDSQPYRYRSLLLSAVMLMLIGWYGLYLLINSTLPTLGPRWLFYVLWTSACTGTSLPFLWFLNRRFRMNEPASPKVLLREGLLIGLYAAICLWLQLNRVLNLTLALLLAIGLFVIEWLLRLIERSTQRTRQ
ncbi:MAG: hypothetical protein A2Z14_03695 [Chloroflexi bacterium RBG_16_48_8]|nr:MAG: hypothetical protein A2Z14_03695 [Chloroflexi bacterium RBG_16_48_8]